MIFNRPLQNQDVRVLLILATYGSTGNRLFDVMRSLNLFGAGYAILISDAYNFPAVFQTGQYNSLVLQGAIIPSASSSVTVDALAKFYSLFAVTYPLMTAGPAATLAYDALQIIAACLASGRVDLYVCVCMCVCL